MLHEGHTPRPLQENYRTEKSPNRQRFRLCEEACIADLLLLPHAPRAPLCGPTWVADDIADGEDVGHVGAHLDVDADESTDSHCDPALSAAIFLPLGVRPTACSTRSYTCGAGGVPPSSTGENVTRPDGRVLSQRKVNTVLASGRAGGATRQGLVPATLDRDRVFP